MCRQRIKSIAVQGRSATFDAIRQELGTAFTRLLGTPFAIKQNGNEPSVVVGLPGTSPLIRDLRWELGAVFSADGVREPHIESV